jgi:hypothetical protein
VCHLDVAIRDELMMGLDFPTRTLQRQGEPNEEINGVLHWAKLPMRLLKSQEGGCQEKEKEGGN